MAEHAPYTVTLKAGRDFDAPWIVISGDTGVQLHARLDELDPDLLAKVATKAKQFANAKSMRLVPVVTQPDGTPAKVDVTGKALEEIKGAIPDSEVVDSPKPTQLGEPEQELPASATPKCEHGLRKYFKAGKHNGEPYPASWRCPLAKSDPNRCKSITA